MNLKKNVLWAVLLPLMFSCSPADKAGEAIRAVLADQQTAWNNGSLEGYMAGYWKSDSLIFLSSKKKLIGWEEALEGYQKSYPDKSAMGHLEFRDIQVRMICRDAAHVTGSWHIDREQLDLHGLFSLLLKKIDGQWKIVLDHSS